jgi:hypothetical protein
LHSVANGCEVEHIPASGDPQPARAPGRCPELIIVVVALPAATSFRRILVVLRFLVVRVVVVVRTIRIVLRISVVGRFDNRSGIAEV